MGWSTNGPTCSSIRNNLSTASDMPLSFYTFGETHWGGCGCFGSTNNAASNNDMRGLALGFRALDGCGLNPCSNGGVCTDVDDSYTCDCADGWKGPNCEIVNPCANVMNPYTSCAAILAEDSQASSGEYCIIVGNNVLEVYCDMNTNGGGYTFVDPAEIAGLTTADLGLLQSDTEEYLIRFLDAGNVQKYGIMSQQDVYSGQPIMAFASEQPGYQAPINSGANYLGTPYLYLAFIPMGNSPTGPQSGRRGLKWGLKVNGVSINTNNCDGNANAYFAFFPVGLTPTTCYVSRMGWSTNGPTCSSIRNNLSTASDMPLSFYTFGETHWGGCGCFGSTNNAASNNDMRGLALGFRGSCFSNQCQNGARCIDGVDSYTCECPPAFTGQYCENDVYEIFGSSPTERSKHDTRKRWTYVDMRTPFPSDGTVTEVALWAGSMSDAPWNSGRKLKVGIFRLIGTQCNFIVIDTMPIGPFTDEGIYEFNVNLDVQAGDYFGFYWWKYGVVSFDFLEENIANRNYCNANKKPLNGELLPLDNESATSYRDYAISFKFIPASSDV